MLFLYIDPGTGSMLLSVLLGAIATLYFLFQSIIIKMKTFFAGGNVKNVSATTHQFVVYCEDKRYVNLFKPVLDEFEKQKTQVFYLSYSEDDPAFSRGYNYVSTKAIGEGNKAYAYLNFLSANIVLMTTPGLHVYQLKRSKNVRHYSFLEHAIADSTQYRLFGLDHFDSLLVNSDYQIPHLRQIEQKRNYAPRKIVTVGCTYLDVFAEKVKQIEKEDDHPFTVLVSPSWGASGLLTLYGKVLLGELIKTGWRIIVRPHPQSKISEAEMLKDLTKLYEKESNIVWDYAAENINSLSKADIMISDFSGIIFDYVFLFDKPVLYNNQQFDIRPYDSFIIDEELWQFKTLRKIGIELKEEMFPTIKKFIMDIKDNDELRKARRDVKAEGWMHQGEAAKRIVDFMIKTAAEANI
ncbi:MAG: CDP-glycerol glycerophosphotransferase family protein [Termitinemataceae bacterium]|nr:MAG: CDP-glycerol glycerophosphotransferase family protein [Termitinemataceae bacterium]